MNVSITKCLQAWANSFAQMNVKADIVFLGDSLTFYGDFSSIFPDKNVCNLGLRGDNIQGMINRVELLNILDPQYVFVMGGINDVAVLSLAEFEKQYMNLVESIIEKIPGVFLTIQSILPVDDVFHNISCNNAQIQEGNEIIRKVANVHNARYLDLFSHYEEDGSLPSIITEDGIHLKKEAYKKWYELIKRTFINCPRWANS